jgi:hypothetical protein
MPFGDPNLIAGIGSLTIDGNQVAVKANMTISCDALERDGIAGQDRVHGYREMPRVPYVEADLSVQHDQSIADLVDIVDSTIVCYLADGRTYALRNSWYVGRTEIATQDGQYRTRFEGMSCQEIM